MPEGYHYNPDHEKLSGQVSLAERIESGEIIKTDKGIAIEKSEDDEQTGPAEGGIYDSEGAEIGFYEIQLTGKDTYKCIIRIHPLEEYKTEPSKVSEGAEALRKQLLLSFEDIEFPLDADSFEASKQEVLQKIPLHFRIRPVKPNQNSSRITEYLDKYQHFVDLPENQTT